MNNVFIRLVMLFSPLWSRLGVHTGQLRLILQVKLTIDDRTPIASFSRQKKQKPTSWATLIQFVVLLLMGAFFLAFFVLIADRFVAFSLYFISVMSVLSLSLVADFSGILLDTRDQYIVLPRPVDDRTVAVARIVHMGVRVLNQLLGVTLPGVLYLLWTAGAVSGMLFIGQVIITGLLSVLLVNVFYLLFLRILSVQRFKDLISYIQIVLSVFIFASYYIGPRLLQSNFVQDIRVEQSPWLWFFPPVWIASLQSLLTPPYPALVLILAALAIVSPVLALWFTTRIFATGFSAKLAGLAAGSDRQTDRA